MSNVTCLINDKVRVEIQNINSYQFWMMINYYNYVVSEYENDSYRKKVKKELDFVHLFLFKYLFL